jgi:metallo-beta-lactamase class B
MKTVDPWGKELEGQLPPKRDIVVTAKPMDLTLGNTTVKLFLMPGHTPGTIWALIPAKEGATTHWLVMVGSGGVPGGNLEPNKPGKDSVLNMGLRGMHESLRGFRDWVAKNGGEGVISTHIFRLNLGQVSGPSLAALKARRANSPHPFVLGKELTLDYFTALDHCTQALMIQAQAQNRK